MKNKLVMFAAALLLVFGPAVVSGAEPAAKGKTQEDTWFSMLVEGTRKSLPPGAQMTTDDKLRFIIMSMALPVKSDKVPPEGFQQQKPKMIKILQNTPDADFIRKTGTTLLYIYITEDYKTFTLIIGPKEL